MREHIETEYSIESVFCVSLRHKQEDASRCIDAQVQALQQKA